MAMEAAATRANDAYNHLLYLLKCPNSGDRPLYPDPLCQGVLRAPGFSATSLRSRPMNERRALGLVSPPRPPKPMTKPAPIMFARSMAPRLGVEVVVVLKAHQPAHCWALAPRIAQRD